MRLLVAGCAGFIGWKVCEVALQEGFEVLGIDNLNDTYDVRLKQWRLAQLLKSSEFSFALLNISDRTAIEDIFQREHIDAIVNLAARAGVRQSLTNPWSYYESNVTGTLNLLACCTDHDIRKFVLASTSSVYAGSPIPFNESQPTDHPLSPYAASKKGAETLCHAYAHLYAIDVAILRYFTVYGPAGRPDMSLFRFVQWIAEERPVTVYGDGMQSRDFTYVDDVARGTLAALGLDGYEIVNLGSDSQATLIDTIHIIEDLVGKKAAIVNVPRHPADMADTRASIDKARERLGWDPKVKLEEGLKRLVLWYQDNRSWVKEIDTR